MKTAKCAGFIVLALYGAAGTFHREWFQILDGANLLFHEAGHVFLRGFGEYPGIWGGTLFQMLFPAGIALGFWKQRQPASAAVMIWWLGQNLLSVSAYIKDSRTQVLPYVGGEIHDWHYLLGYHQLLSWDQPIGNAVGCLGFLTMLAACAYGLKVVLRGKEKVDLS